MHWSCIDEAFPTNITSPCEDISSLRTCLYWFYPQNDHNQAGSVTTGSPRDRIGPEAGRLRLSHWAGPSVTESAKLSQSFYGGIIIMILTKGKPVPLAWEFIYKLGEVTRVTSTILPNMGRKCVTEAWWVWCVTQPGAVRDRISVNSEQIVFK